MELLNQSIVWWHWIILGLVLIITEMSTGTFISLGLGIAALAVGLIDWIIPMEFVYQLGLWIIFSIVFVTLLFRRLKREPTVSQSGQSTYRLDTLGTVTSVIQPHKRGKVTFDSPVLGNTDWHATSNVKLEIGARIKIIEVNGQLIKVTPINQ
jgi:membrane protein implicated in regulation of membrane protease activity